MARTIPFENMKDEVIESLNQLADRFKSGGRKLQKLRKEVGEDKVALIQEMREHKKTDYVDREHGYRVQLVASKENVRVKKLGGTRGKKSSAG